MTTATYTKLRTGSWGLRGRGFVAGERTLVIKRSGERQAVTVERILWTGDDGQQIATIDQRYGVTVDRPLQTARPRICTCGGCGAGSIECC